MPMTVACDDCGRKYSVLPTHLGKRVKCKNCGHVFAAVQSAAAVSESQKVLATAACSSAIAVAKPPVRTSPKVKPIPSASPAPVIENEIDDRSKKSRSMLISSAILCSLAIAVVGLLLGYKYYQLYRQRAVQHNFPQTSAITNPLAPTAFSSSGFHVYADLNTQQQRTKNNLEILTTEVQIYKDRHDGQLPNSLDDLDLHYGGNDPRKSPFDDALGKHGYGYISINVSTEVDRVMLYDIGELQQRGITHVVMSKYHQIRTMDREQLFKQPNVSQ